MTEKVQFYKNWFNWKDIWFLIKPVNQFNCIWTSSRFAFYIKHTPHNTTGYQNYLKGAKLQNVIKVDRCSCDIPLRSRPRGLFYICTQSILNCVFNMCSVTGYCVTLATFLTYECEPSIVNCNISKACVVGMQESLSWFIC